jgi:hypothetical protein
MVLLDQLVLKDQQGLKVRIQELRELRERQERQELKELKGQTQGHKVL